MTLAQYLRVIRAQWLLIVGLTVLGGLGAAAYSWTATPVYSADAQMFVTVNGAQTDIGSLQQGSTFTQQRVKSYAAIMNAPEVLDPVIAQLGLQTTSEALAKHVTASSPLDTVLLGVSVTDTSPTRARDIANAVARQFTTYVTRLELPTGAGTSPVKVTVTSPATTPSAPDSPRKSLNLALGLLVGLGLGLAVAVLRDSLDRTINTRHDAGEIAGAPVLAAVMEDPGVTKAPLIIHDAFSPRAEAFRTLRTNIRFLSVDREVRSLVVTSSIASEGKSTTAANLALVMAQSGEKVILVDADLRRPQASEIFGLSAGVGLTSVLVGDTDVADAMQQWRDDLDLHVLTSGPVPPNPSELIGSHRMVALIEELVTTGYVVVVDSPPLLPVTDAAILARITDGALVVTRAGSTKIEQLAGAAEVLRTAGAGILGIVVNRVPKSGRYAGYYRTYESYAPTTLPSAPTESPSRAPSPTGEPAGVTTRASRRATAAADSDHNASRLGAPAPLPVAAVDESPHGDRVTPPESEPAAAAPASHPS